MTILRDICLVSFFFLPVILIKIPALPSPPSMLRTQAPRFLSPAPIGQQPLAQLHPAVPQTVSLLTPVLLMVSLFFFCSVDGTSRLVGITSNHRIFASFQRPL